MNFYKHHIGDYAQATSHLSFVEDAAYSRMIRKYYAEEKALPADPKAVQRLIGARTKEERAAVLVVLEEFFALQEDGWHNKRCDAELAASEDQDSEREAKLDNERERQRRHREERKRLFEQLRARDVVPAWDTKTDALRAMLKGLPVTGSVTEPETLPVTPVTPPVTRTATANQTPDSRHQTPDSRHQTPDSRLLVGIEEKSSSGNSVAAALAPAPPRGTRLPAEWALPRPWGDWALAELPGWTVETVRLEAAKFADHWRAKAGKDATKADWQATWRNWCRNARLPAPPRPGAAPQLTTEQRNTEAKRLLGFDIDQTHLIGGQHAAQ